MTQDKNLQLLVGVKSKTKKSDTKTRRNTKKIATTMPVLRIGTLPGQ